MELDKIQALTDLMRASGLSELSLDEGGDKLSLKMGSVSTPVMAEPISAAVPQPADQPAALSVPPEESGVVTVTSPMVGVFYAAPSPEEKVFVSVGETVSQGDVLCIIEAMKLMNEIVAEDDGVVIEVCAGNGQLVEFGQPLFRIRRRG